MGKFENGKYVCIIKWCFRSTKCGWDGVERKVGAIHKSREKEQARKQDETVECAEKSAWHKCGWHLVNESSPEGTERATATIWNEPSKYDQTGETGEREEETEKEKKENRKIIIYIYILFSFMYARNCKNGESDCRPLGFFILISSVMYHGEHTHTSSSTSSYTYPQHSTTVGCALRISHSRSVCFYEK